MNRPVVDPQLSATPVELVVAPAEADERLDFFLALHFSDYSRGHFRRVITAGGAKVDGRGSKPAYRLRPGQHVIVVLPESPPVAATGRHPPGNPLRRRRPAGDQQAAGHGRASRRGHWSGTLAGALQYHFGPSLSQSGGPTRPGIVHRLDRQTSGVILVARTDQAHHKLAAQFQNRTIEKEYFAIVSGVPERDRDFIDRAIGVHPVQREKMAIRRDDPASRAAQTFYEVLERFQGFAALKVLPKTGRTHQIRVHLGHVGFPVLCDRQYGGRAEITRGEIRRDPEDTLVLLARQALHARRLRFLHPSSGVPLEIEAPLPADMLGVLAELRQFLRHPGITRLPVPAASYNSIVTISRWLLWLGGLGLLAGCIAEGDTDATGAKTTHKEPIAMSDSSQSGGASLPKTDEQWRKVLAPELYRVARQKGTEPAFTGKYYQTTTPGVYRWPVAAALFESDAEFDAGCGWPSFSKPLDAKNIDNRGRR